MNFMVLICRTFLLLVFALYWGGLTFYTGFAVRIVHDVLNDPMDGGLITQRVTSVLQILGVLTVLLMGWNCLLVFRQSRRLGYFLIGFAALVGFSLFGLFVIHGRLDAMINVETSSITDQIAFDADHRRYNQLTTIQWLASLLYLPITVVAWRYIDASENRLEERH